MNKITGAVLLFNSLLLSANTVPLTKLTPPISHGPQKAYFIETNYWGELQKLPSCHNSQNRIVIPSSIQGVYRGEGGSVRKVDEVANAYRIKLLYLQETPLLRLGPEGVTGASLQFKGYLRETGIYAVPPTQTLNSNNFCIKQSYSPASWRNNHTATYQLTFRSFNPSNKLWQDKETYILKFAQSGAGDQSLELVSFELDGLFLSKRISSIEDYGLTGSPGKFKVFAAHEVNSASLKYLENWVYHDRNNSSVMLRYYPANSAQR